MPSRCSISDAEAGKTGADDDDLIPALIGRITHQNAVALSVRDRVPVELHAAAHPVHNPLRTSSLFSKAANKRVELVRSS